MTLVRALIGLAVAPAIALITVDSAAAARPVRDALYADGVLGYTPYAYLRIADDGRSLDPRRSRIEGDPGVGPGLACQDRPSIVRIGARGQRVRVTQAGRFRLVRRVGRYVLRMRGRFITKDSARITFRYRREPARARPRRCDDTGRVRLRPARIRPIPFKDCSTHEARTVVRTATGRVFWQPAWDRAEGWTKVAYACLFSANERFKLHRDEDDDSDLSHIRLAGPYVAYAWHPCGGAACLIDVVQMRDLRDGRWLDVDDGPSGNVTDLELKENGSLAVITHPYDPYPSPAEVWVDDTLGTRQLDAGTNIEDSSLTLQNSTLSWKKAGVTHTATLY